MKVYVKNEKMRVCEGYGHYMNRRYEAQEKYSYWENDKKIESWRCLFHSKELEYCMKYFEKYKDRKHKDYSITIDEDFPFFA